MKKLLGLLLLIGLAVPVLPAQAESVESSPCDDLLALGGGLLTVGDIVAADTPIAEGDELDLALGEMVDALHDVAEATENEGLHSSVQSLDSAWQVMDRIAFVDALDLIIDDLGVIYESSCVAE